MPGKKKISSRRSEQEIDDIYLKSYEATKKAIELINKNLDSGKGLTDEEFRFLKRSPDLIATFKAREKQKEGRDTKQLPEGKLKEFIEQAWRLKKIGEPDQVIEATGYYRCEGGCGELHIKGRECMYLEFEKKKEEQRAKIDRDEPE